MLTKKLEQWLDLATAQLRCGAAVQPGSGRTGNPSSRPVRRIPCPGGNLRAGRAKNAGEHGRRDFNRWSTGRSSSPSPCLAAVCSGRAGAVRESSSAGRMCVAGHPLLRGAACPSAGGCVGGGLFYGSGGADAPRMACVWRCACPGDGSHFDNAACSGNAYFCAIFMFLFDFGVCGGTVSAERKRNAGPCNGRRGTVDGGFDGTLCPAFSVALSLFLAGLVLSLYCGWSNWFGLGRGKSLGVVLAAAFTPGVGILLLPGVATRVMERLNPFFDPTGSGWISLMRLTIWQGRSPLQPVAQQWLDRVPENMFQNMTEQTIFHLLGAEDPLTWSAYAFGRPAALALLAGVAFCLFVLWRAALGTRNASGRLLGVACVSLLTTQLLVSAAFCGGVMVPFLSDGLWNGCTQAVLVGTLLSAVRLDPVKGGQLLSAPGEKVGVWKRLLG